MRVDDFKKVQDTERYSDFYNNMTVHPETGALLRKKDVDAIKASVKNIVLTMIGERPFSDLGCDIYGEMFELFSPQSAQNIKTQIENAIENYERRCKILRIDVLADEANHLYKVIIQFMPLFGTEVEQLSLVLKKTR